MNFHQHRRISGWLGALVWLFSCDSARQGPPPAQDSSPEPASAIVRVEQNEPFAPACLIVDSGATVEWRNLSPRVSVVVLSVAAPFEISSPALLSPYDFVPPAMSDECALRLNGACLEPEPFSFWRHTFNTAGVFDYRDPSGSAIPATNSDGDEYGMPASPQPMGGGAGTVCVRGPGSDCQQVCCTGAMPDECAPGVKCISGRCGGVPQS
jgi:hypothetical protein